MARLPSQISQTSVELHRIACALKGWIHGLSLGGCDSRSRVGLVAVKDVG